MVLVMPRAGILAKDDYRPISAFRPCRVSIYQISRGEVSQEAAKMKTLIAEESSNVF